MEHERIDVERLARRDERLEGRWPQSAFERLGSLLSSDAGDVDWHVRAWWRLRPEGAQELHLALGLRTVLSVPCSRCLAPVEVAVDEEREFLLVADEETAEALDDPDSPVDVVAADKPFQLADLVEDELILAIPPLPRHADCELAVPVDLDDAGVSTPRRPFEALAGLRTGGEDPGDGDGGERVDSRDPR